MFQTHRRAAFNQDHTRYKMLVRNGHVPHDKFNSSNWSQFLRTVGPVTRFYYSNMADKLHPALLKFFFSGGGGQMIYITFHRETSEIGMSILQTFNLSPYICLKNACHNGHLSVVLMHTTDR